MKKVIYTTIDKNYVDIASITQQHNLSYACNNSADFINFTYTKNPSTPHLSKIEGAIKLLEMGYDQILYVDADAVFLDNDVNIFDLFSIFKEKELHFCAANRERTVLDTGLFLAKNTDNVKKFLNECKESTDCENYPVTQVWKGTELYKTIVKVHETTAFNENSRWVCHPTFIYDTKYSGLDKIQVKKIILEDRLNNRKECRYSFADRMFEKLDSMIE